MGWLDCLIDKDNGNPKAGMEYIYLLDIGWTTEWRETSDIHDGDIVTDVIKRENRSYEFTHKKTGQRMRTNYAWTLAENTPKNIRKIKKYKKARKRLKEFETDVLYIQDEIVTLKNRNIKEEIVTLKEIKNE